jgi:hypothetical protein
MDRRYPADTSSAVMAYKTEPPGWFKEGAKRVHLDDGMRMVSFEELDKLLATREVESALDYLKHDAYNTGDLRDFKVAELDAQRKRFTEAAVKVGRNIEEFDKLLAELRPKNVAKIFDSAVDSAIYELSTAEDYLLEGDLEFASQWVKYAEEGLAWIKLQGDACGKVVNPGLVAEVSLAKEAVAKTQVKYAAVFDVSLGLSASTIVLTPDNKLAMLEDPTQITTTTTLYETETAAKATGIPALTKVLQDRGSRKKPSTRKVAIVPEPFNSELRAKIAERALGKAISAGGMNI